MQITQAWARNKRNGCKSTRASAKRILACDSEVGSGCKQYLVCKLNLVPLLKKMWENLAQTHRITRRRAEGRSGDGAEDVEPDWKFWDKMAFLRAVNTFADQQ